MKKLLLFSLCALLLVSLIGCDFSTDTPHASALDETSNMPETYETFPLPDPDQVTVETLEDNDYVYGTITAKYENGVLALAPDTPRMVERWGTTVYIRTDQASEWCVGDQIDVRFTTIERPSEPEQPIMIIADEVHPLVMDAKPVIYLYPETPTEVSVNLTLNGRLTCTYPDYDKGWQNFTAHPDGTLIFPDGKEYYCLYWEGMQTTEWDFSQGFCVKGEDTAAFLEWALAEQGLTPREANEFIIYWLPLMQENPYNVISFQTDAYTDGAVLEITPTPDSLIRVFMAWYATDTAVELSPQTFDPHVRDGFTAVEWGGSQVKAP